MPSSVESVEDKKKSYSQELAAYTLRQWEIFHSQSPQAQGFAEQQRHNRKSPPTSGRSQAGQVLCRFEVDATVLTSPFPLFAPFALGLQVAVTTNRRHLPAERRWANFWANGEKIGSPR